MRRTVVTIMLLVPLTMLSAGCGAALDQFDDVRTRAEQTTDRARFCLALTRTLRAVESGAPATAMDAAEETLATVPRAITDEARAVVEAVRRALDGDGSLRDSRVRDATRHLKERADTWCDPTG